MHRFRPIAPKPVIDGSNSSANSKQTNGVVYNSVRTKRKYVRVKNKNQNNNNNNHKQKKKKKYSSSSTRDLQVTTLQLLPEKNDLAGDQSGSSCVDHTVRKDSADEIKQVSCCGADQTVAETVVTVESVINTCMEGDLVVEGIGGGGRSTDVERMKSILEKDTCPGFISDGSGRVQWVNEAYKKMWVGGKEITVRLVVKEKVLPYLNNYQAFTCWVRLHCTWHKDKYSHTQIVPCDVWRLSFGGFAWRLDVKAALSLGLF